MRVKSLGVYGLRRKEGKRKKAEKEEKNLNPKGGLNFMFRSRFLVHFNDLYARMIWGNKLEAKISKKLTSMDIITILIYI